MYIPEPELYRVYAVDDVTGAETPTNEFLHPGERDTYLDGRNNCPGNLGITFVAKPVSPILLQPQLT